MPSSLKACMLDDAQSAAGQVRFDCAARRPQPRGIPPRPLPTLRALPGTDIAAQEQTEDGQRKEGAKKGGEKEKEGKDEAVVRYLVPALLKEEEEGEEEAAALDAKLTCFLLFATPEVLRQLYHPTPRLRHTSIPLCNAMSGDGRVARERQRGDGSGADADERDRTRVAHVEMRQRGRERGLRGFQKRERETLEEVGGAWRAAGREAHVRRAWCVRVAQRAGEACR
eukprot:3933368-Rhodomonas_salina.1